MEDYHITKKGDQWQLKKEGASRAIKKTDTKKEAIDFTREFMKDKKGSVKIHKLDNTIQEERTYQRKDDPPKSKG